MTKPQPYCVALQPICDSQMIHVADELLYRSASSAASAVFEDDLTATARVCNAAFYETGIENLCGSGKLFFNAPRDWLLKPELLPPYPEQVVIEVLESVQGDEEVIEALKKIKELGYQIALDDFVLNEDTSALVELADIVKLDMLAKESFDSIDVYLSKGILLLAEKVEDMATFERCKALGFSLFQGYFYAKPEVKSATSVKRSSNNNIRMEILRELYEDEVDLTKVEKLLMLEPQLVLRLLRMINSAQYKRANTISSLNQAVTLLGIAKLRTLVCTLVLANDHPCKMLLLPKVLTRASMCQKVAQNEFKVNPEEAFMVGLLSLAGLMLDQSIEKVCEQLPLNEATHKAVTAYEGKLGQVLLLVTKFESAKLVSAGEVTVSKLNGYYLSSRSWAMSMLADIQG